MSTRRKHGCRLIVNPRCTSRDKDSSSNMYNTFSEQAGKQHPYLYAGFLSAEMKSCPPVLPPFECLQDHAPFIVQHAPKRLTPIPHAAENDSPHGDARHEPDATSWGAVHHELSGDHPGCPLPGPREAATTSETSTLCPRPFVHSVKVFVFEDRATSYARGYTRETMRQNCMQYVLASGILSSNHFKAVASLLIPSYYVVLSTLNGTRHKITPRERESNAYCWPSFYEEDIFQDFTLIFHRFICGFYWRNPKYLSVCLSVCLPV